MAGGFGLHGSFYPKLFTPLNPLGLFIWGLELKWVKEGFNLCNLRTSRHFYWFHAQTAPARVFSNPSRNSRFQDKKYRAQHALQWKSFSFNSNYR